MLNYSFENVSQNIIVSDNLRDCIEYMPDKFPAQNINLDCLIQKQVFQVHNFILYLIIASYLIYLIFPFIKLYLQHQNIYWFSIHWFSKVETVDIISIFLFTVMFTIFYINGILTTWETIFSMLGLAIIEWCLARIYERWKYEF